MERGTEQRRHRWWRERLLFHAGLSDRRRREPHVEERQQGAPGRPGHRRQLRRRQRLFRPHHRRQRLLLLRHELRGAALCRARRGAEPGVGRADRISQSHALCLRCLGLPRCDHGQQRFQRWQQRAVLHGRRRLGRLHRLGQHQRQRAASGVSGAVQEAVRVHHRREHLRPGRGRAATPGRRQLPRRLGGSGRVPPERAVRRRRPQSPGRGAKLFDDARSLAAARRRLGDPGHAGGTSLRRAGRPHRPFAAERAPGLPLSLHARLQQRRRLCGDAQRLAARSPPRSSPSAPASPSAPTRCRTRARSS